MSILILTVVAVVTAVFAIQGEAKPRRTQVYIFKPLTTLLIILIALTGGSAVPPPYQALIVIGLLFCLGGDVLLMLPPRYFIFGLVSFLIGHLLYVAAFVADAGFTISWWGLPLLLLGLFIYRLLHAHLGRLRGPVIAYILIILLMAWQALGRWSATPTIGALLAASGALSFVASDAALALDRFRARFRHARLVVLSSYWLAQWLIALSIGGYLRLVG
jgi:uncharacterized membrane protein YhhN